MSSLITSTAPLPAGQSFVSGAYPVTRALNITGTVFADQPGTWFVDQGGDGINWDFTTSGTVTANTGASINVAILDQYVQVRFTNTSGSAQTVFRLNADLRDPYGAFLVNALPPSAGGAYVVLFQAPGQTGYSYVGRFDGTDAWNAITNAALSNNANGKYAAFVAATAVVSGEIIQKTTQHSPQAF